ncbi:hypothetical protein [Nocardia sp. NPDC050435]|uniref:hypothetical protein n=1 Tax=Nocardia sp. NPDC050435 TaxID=3155040 RepID=UPI0033FB1C61
MESENHASPEQDRPHSDAELAEAMKDLPPEMHAAIFGGNPSIAWDELRKRRETETD